MSDNMGDNMNRRHAEIARGQLEKAKQPPFRVPVVTTEHFNDPLVPTWECLTHRLWGIGKGMPCPRCDRRQ